MNVALLSSLAAKNSCLPVFSASVRAVAVVPGLLNEVGLTIAASEGLGSLGRVSMQGVTPKLWVGSAKASTGCSGADTMRSGTTDSTVPGAEVDEAGDERESLDDCKRGRGLGDLSESALSESASAGKLFSVDDIKLAS